MKQDKTGFGFNNSCTLDENVEYVRYYSCLHLVDDLKDLKKLDPNATDSTLEKIANTLFIYLNNTVAFSVLVAKNQSLAEVTCPTIQTTETPSSTTTCTPCPNTTLCQNDPCPKANPTTEAASSTTTINIEQSMSPAVIMTTGTPCPTIHTTTEKACPTTACPTTICPTIYPTTEPTPTPKMIGMITGTNIDDKQSMTPTTKATSTINPINSTTNGTNLNVTSVAGNDRGHSNTRLIIGIVILCFTIVLFLAISYYNNWFR